jgi:hypothetical protein
MPPQSTLVSGSRQNGPKFASDEEGAKRTGIPVVASPVIPKRLPLFQRAWPPILLMLGLVATLAWTAFLGFLLVEAESSWTRTAACRLGWEGTVQ